MLIRALTLSFRQLGDRRIIAIFAKSMLITLIICAGLVALLGLGGQSLIERWGVATKDYGGLLVAAAWLLSFAAAMLAFRAVAVPVVGFFGDDVVAVIEQRYYPEAATGAHKATIGTSLRLALASIGRVLLVNLLATPVYLFLLVTAVGPLILFLLLNGVLLGRDFAEMVAVRHLEPSAMKQWLRNHRIDYALLGLAITALFMIPFANLAAPVLGAAAAAHLFHGKSR